MLTVEELTYIGAPAEAVCRLVDLAQHAWYCPPSMRCVWALTARADEPGARIEMKVRLVGPF
jgi:hypothetical protein